MGVQFESVERAPGFYWLRIDGEWTIGLLRAGEWKIIGSDEVYCGVEGEPWTMQIGSFIDPASNAHPKAASVPR